VKAIRAAVPGATVNDVVLAAIGVAMRKYLQNNKELPKVTLSALSPVNTRPDKGATAAAGNNISAVTFPLRTDIENPLERLRAVHEATARTKETANAIGASELTDLSKFAPPATLAFAGRLLSLSGLGGAGPFPMHHTIVSNVPGPNVPVYFLGARLRYLSCVTPICDGAGLFHAVTSCDGKLVISPTSTPQMLPDPAAYTQCLRDSFTELGEAAAAAPGTGDALPKKKRTGSAKTPAARHARRTAKPCASPAARS
jgi:WS/DGAT/MGAT family acyltransferase